MDSYADLVGVALRGPHNRFALGESQGQVMRYRPDLASFASLGPSPDALAWEELTALPGDRVALVTDTPVVAVGPWERLQEIAVLRMSGAGVAGDATDAEIVSLGDEDVPEMLALAGRTAPGPFLPRTIEFGGYLGVRRDGALVAMAGQRMRVPGWTEVSAVCTDPAHRGLGLARRLIAAVVANIRSEGAEAFLHVLPSNPARRLYEALGFSAVQESTITALQRTG
jgi:ribosomal protein S18 acetylase RimI-like enzyme